MIIGNIWEEALDEFIEGFRVTTDAARAAAAFILPNAGGSCFISVFKARNACKCRCECLASELQALCAMYILNVYFCFTVEVKKNIILKGNEKVSFKCLCHESRCVIIQIASYKQVI